MVSDWDLRACTDAPFYVFRDASAGPEEFSESGVRALADVVLDGIELSRDAIAVEIGCGIGRLARELAPQVSRLIACDISEEMLSRGRARCAGIPNVEFVRIDGDLSPVPSQSADFVFSHLVFQHLPRRRFVRRYLSEAFRTLKPGGVFRADVDGRSHQWLRRAIADSWSGIVYSEAGWRRDLASAGFEIETLSGAGTQYLRATARKPGRSDSGLRDRDGGMAKSKIEVRIRARNRGRNS